MKKDAYARAGVDINLGNRVKATLPQLLASTHRKEVLGKAGGFGGLFALDTRRYKQPVLVSSVDGVGTKLKVGFAVGRHDTIGQDLVNHCVNDIVVLGAEALFFLDYIGAGKLDPKIFQEIIQGFALACSENGCALIGGETAQMPGFYQPGEYDVSGTVVGVVEKREMLSGAGIKPGDAIIGFESNGLHTNGYSLARKILFDKMKLKPASRLPDCGLTVGDELLRVHRSYAPLAHQLLKKLNRRGSKASGPRAIKAFAHITGGGFVDNIPRVLPGKCDAIIRKGTWESQPIFQILQKQGRVQEEEMYHVFNMGIGMVVIAAAAAVDSVTRMARRANHRAWVIGEITRGSGSAKVV